MNSIEPSSPSAQPNKQTLGNDRKIRVPKLPDVALEKIETPTEKRYRLQDVAREICGERDPRLQRCLRCKLPTADVVEVRQNESTKSAHYRGLEVCSRVWLCPVCSARITNERREELSRALAAAKLRGYFPVLVTYTLQHNYRDRLETVLAGLLDSLRLFKSGRAYQQIKFEYDILGGIRALEATYGGNGWHPHVHELLFLEKPISDQQVAGLKKWFADRWISSLQKLGFDASFAHGLDVRTADSEIADYIAKYGHEPHEMTWQVEHEIAKAPAKSAHRDGLTPFELLDCYYWGDQLAGKLFLDYAAAMHDRRQLVWSAGLRKLLELPEELADEQIPLFEEAPEVETIVEIDGENWSRCCAAGIRGEILFLASIRYFDGLRKLFKRWRIEALLYDDLPVKCDQQPATLIEPAPVPVQIGLFAPGEVKAKFEYA